MIEWLVYAPLWQLWCTFGIGVMIIIGIIMYRIGTRSER